MGSEKENSEGAVIKLSSDPGKASIPGTPNIEIRDDGRYIVQEHEEVHGQRLLQPVVQNGRVLFDEDDFAAIDKATERVEQSARFISLPTIKSELTQALTAELTEKAHKGLVAKKEFDQAA